MSLPGRGTYFEDVLDWGGGGGAEITTFKTNRWEVRRVEQEDIYN